MPRTFLPMTVHTARGDVDLDVRCGGRPLWSDVRPRVLAAAGLAPDTTLYLGIGPVEPGWPLGSPPLLRGIELSTTPAVALPDRPPVVVAVVAGPDAGRQWPLPTRPMTVGRDPAADLLLTDPQVSYRHALLEPSARGLVVSDLGSTNGVRVDGEPAPVRAAATGAGAPRSVADPGRRALTGSLIRIGGTLLQIQLAAGSAGGQTPDGQGCLVRRRPPPAAPPEPPPIPDDPGPVPQRQRRPLPLVAAILGAAVGAGLALVLGSPAYLAFAALGPVTMIGTALSDRVTGRRSYRRELAAHRAATERRAEAMHAAAAARAAWAWDHWPDPATLLRRAESGDARLWGRRPDAADYLALSVGAHADPADGGDAAPDRRAGIDVPVTAGLAAAGVVRLVGPRGRASARWLLMQAAALHSPADVAIHVVGAAGDLRPCRLLPHAPRGDPGRGAAGLLNDLATAGVRDLLVVLDGAEATASAPGVGFLAAAERPADRPAAPPTGAPAPRVHVLCLLQAAPRTRHPDPAPPAVDVTGVGPDLLARTCRALAPLREERETSARTPPPAVSLADLMGSVTAESLRERWRRPSPVGVLGAAAGGTATLDLGADGPHLLVAGTTGSGKSELLLTLIASLAAASPPSHLTFLLVDYKGGAAFDAVGGLPHVVGTVTDLDPSSAARALASLRAELRRRERLAVAGGPEAPRLVIVVDEFATLAAELPEFLSGILDVAQRGRSLGLHLVLATQRPAGVVSPAMRSNIAARICLRVTDTTDSVDVIDAPDAARISPGTPGRALLRTGRGLTAFQTALATAPPGPDLEVVAVAPADLAGIPDAASGRDGADAGPDGTGPAPARPDADPGGAPSILRQVVAAAIAAAAGRPAPHRPWLPPLPRRYRRPDRTGVLALADLPDSQARRDLLLPEASVLVTGPTGSGRSTALRRIGSVAAARGAELLVIDATGGLADLRAWPAVSSYLTADTPRLLLRLTALLADPARRPPPGQARWLLVDGLDLAAAAMDRADYVAGSAALAELPTRSGGTVRLAVAGPPALVHHRLVAEFATVIELGGAATGTEAIPGRARWAGRAVQITDAPPGSAPRVGSSPSTGPDGGPDGVPAGPAPATGRRVIVRPLPALVAPRSLPAASPDAVPLGLGGDEAGPVTVDLAGTGGAIVVGGRRRTGVSTALAVLAVGAARAGIPVVYVDEGRCEGAAHPGIEWVDLRAGTDPLRLLLASHAGPVLLVVDQAGRGTEHPAADLFERFCQVCGRGQYLLLGERTDELARAHRGHLRAALAFRRGLLLSPDPADGSLLDVPLPRRDGRVPPGRGVWAESGWPTPVQVAAMPRPGDRPV